MSEGARRRIASALWALAAAAWLAPLASGFFLSDDFVIFAAFGDAEAKGTLLQAAFAKFTAGLDVATSRFYRPLPHLSFAACYALFGANGTPWLLVNLAAQLASAILVAVLAWQLGGESSWRSVLAGLAGATVFVAFAPGLEAAAWVAARYDTFATLFALAACVAFAASRRAWDVAMWISLAAFVLAVLCKESAAIVPPAIVVLALWRRRDEPLNLARRISSALVDAWPWLAFAAAYLLVRTAIFGTPFEVYAGSKPAGFAFSPERWGALGASIAPWIRAQFPDAGMRLTLGIVIAALLALAIAIAVRDARARAGVLVALALGAASDLLLAPHLGGLEADGSSGRLFHLTGAFLGLLVGVACARPGMRGAGSAIAIALAIAVLSTGTAARDRWVEAHSAMRAVAADLGRLHASLGEREHALVVIPHALGPIAFGLNAQAGLMLPPVQQRPIADRVLVQTARELPDTAAGYARGLIANLRTLPLLEVAAKRIDGPAEFPTQVHCWPKSGSQLVQVPAPAPTDPAMWLRSLRAALAAHGCGPE